MNPPRSELDYAVRLIFSEHGINLKRPRFLERGKAIVPDSPAPAPETSAEILPPRRRRKRRRGKNGPGTTAI
jgi:poly(A) polymerase